MSAYNGELFIAWRYLYRRRKSRVLVGWTLANLVLGLVALGTYFTTGHAFAAIAEVPLFLLFITSLLLNFFSVFTSFAIVGVTLGVAALTVVLSVTSGFQSSFRAKVLGVNAHVLVLKYGLDFSEWRDVIKKAEKLPHVRAASPFVFNEMMVARGPALSGVLIKGIDTELSPRVIDIAERLEGGVKVADLAKRLPPSDGGPPLPEMFIGVELRKKLKAKIGDRVRVVSPKADLDPMQWASSGSTASVREFRVGGVFYSGFDEYDRRLAYVTLAEAQAFHQSGDVVTGVEMKLDDVDLAPRLAEELHKTLGGAPYRTIDWQELNHNLFTALRMQKTVIVTMLTLIILVAAFNIVAALTMMVIDKRREIAILKSMGMRAGGTARIFQWAGILVGGVGTLAGLGLGLLVCKTVDRYGYKLDAKVYLIDQLPVQISGHELWLTAAITMGICFLATLYPAVKATLLAPVDGLRED